MLSADPLAFRPGAPEEPPGSAPWPLGSAPARLATQLRDPLGPRLRRSSASTAVSALVHAGLVLVFLSVWHGMVRDLTTAASEGITVDLVQSVPGEKPPPKAPAPKPAIPAPPPPPPPPTPPPSDPKPAATPTPSPKPSAVDEALGRPALVEPPPEGRAAASQSETNQRGNMSTATDGARQGTAGTPDAAHPPIEKAAKPRPAPQVMTAEGGDTSIPTAAKAEPDADKAPVNGDPTQAANAAHQLSSALATDSVPMPLSFRAALSARGSSDNATYRGSVFGAISRVQNSVQAEARQKRLKGQVVIALVLTDTGSIASLTVVQSSGDAGTDAFAVAMMRRAAPFPPPPPGASRTFTPAISFGNEG